MFSIVRKYGRAWWSPVFNARICTCGLVKLWNIEHEEGNIRFWADVLASPWYIEVLKNLKLVPQTQISGSVIYLINTSHVGCVSCVGKELADPGFMVRPRVRGHTFSKRIQARFLTFRRVLKNLVWFRLRHYFFVTFARKLFFDMTSTVWSHEGWHCHMVDSAVKSHRQCCHIRLRHYLFHI